MLVLIIIAVVAGLIAGGVFWWSLDSHSEAPLVISFVAAFTAGIALFLLGIFGTMRYITHRNCAAYGRESGFEVKWVDISLGDFGCYVKVDGKWIDRDDVIVTVTK